MSNTTGWMRMWVSRGDPDPSSPENLESEAFGRGWEAGIVDFTSEVSFGNLWKEMWDEVNRNIYCREWIDFKRGYHASRLKLSYEQVKRRVNDK